MEQSLHSEQTFQIRTRSDFEILFKSHYSSLCSYANHFLKDLDASEEIVQEVMFKIWLNRDSFMITSSLKSYLFRAVRNGCLNALKHIDIREEYKTRKEQDIQENQRSKEDEMIVTELEEKISQAIDRLPMERKKIFILSRYDGMTYSQIAGKLGISVKTVENQMGKALKSLREELSEYLPWLILFFTNLIK